ncbi:MAG: hypothetical protein ACOYND_08365 [Bacteroidota bacterium]
MQKDLIKQNNSLLIDESILISIKTIKEEINSIHEQYFYLNQQVKPLLLKDYDDNFRLLEIEIQRKALESSELQRRAELLMMKHQRGEKLTPEIIALVHKIVDKEYLSIKSRLNDAFDRIQKKQAYVSSLQEPQNSQELMQKYRELAKLLHPDTNKNQLLVDKYWHMLQQGFTDRNITSIRALYSLLIDKMKPDTSFEMSILDQQKELERLLHIKSIEEKKLQELKKQIPFIYELGLQDDQWISNHRKSLELQIHKYQEDIQKAQQLIKIATGIAYKYSDIPEKLDEFEDKKSIDYQDDFMENTYFSGRH